MKDDQQMTGARVAFDQALQTYRDHERKHYALKRLKEKNFTKDQLEHMISLTMTEGGLPLREIFALWDEWEKIIKLEQLQDEGPVEHLRRVLEEKKKAPYMDLDD